MADISTYLAAIMSAVYGEEVRGSIHDAIEIINEVSEVVLSTGTEINNPSSSSTGFYRDSLYLNTSTYELWKCIGADTWQSLGILKGASGAAGNGIDNIAKTSTSGLVDTYTITYTDGTTDTFNVTNGSIGEDGVGVTGVSLIEKVGLLATYRMSFSDGTYFDYTVSDGASGSGTGDMTKAVYDTNNNGIVDAAETLQGLVASIADLNKTASLATVATSGSYNDLLNKPTIPAAQVNSDWNASSGIAQILNKPTIPAAQVNSDWNAVSGVAQILNKPTIPAVNDGAFTVKQNGATKGSSTANQSTASEADIVTDEWTSTATVSSSGEFTFTGLDDTKGYGYKPFAVVTDASTNKNPTAQISSITGAGTASMSVSYTTDADSGATVKLRIIK